MAKLLALTSGEPAGIGPDIALEAWLRRAELDLPPFYLLGDRAFFAERAKILGLKVELADARPEDARVTFAHALPVVATGETATAQPGLPDVASTICLKPLDSSSFVNDCPAIDAKRLKTT